MYPCACENLDARAHDERVYRISTCFALPFSATLEQLLLVQSLAIRLCALLACVGAALLYAPVQAPQPLVPSTGWTIEGQAFRNTQPSERQALRSMLSHPDAVFLRTWAPQTGATHATIVSAPFRAPEYVAIPIAGYPIDPGVNAYLECSTNGARFNVASGNPHEDWSLVYIAMPADWCTGDTRLVARNESQSYIAIGTPFAISWGTYVKRSAPVIFFLHAVAWCALTLPLALLAHFLRRKGLGVLAPLASIATLGLGCYALFFIYWLKAPFGSALAMFAVGASLLLSLRWLMSGGANELKNEITQGGLHVLYFASLSVVLVAYTAAPGAGIWDMAYRYLPAVWSSDHMLPHLVAEGFYQGRGPQGLLGGAWLVSDRPPLMSGLLLYLRPTWEMLLSSAHADTLLPTAQLIVETIAMCWAIVAGVMYLWSVAADRAPNSVTWAFIVVALLLSPFMLFNASYGWPKLLSAAMALFAVVALRELLGEPAPSDARRRGAMATILAGVFLALAMLSHSSVAFGLVFLPWLVALGNPSARVWRSFFVAGAIGALLFLPWLVWQKWVDPPGNALLKYALAGVLDQDRPSRPLLEAVTSAYDPLSFSQWLATKAGGIFTMLGLALPPEMPWYTRYQREAIGAMRATDFLASIGSLRFLLVPLTIAFLPFALTSRMVAMRDIMILGRRIALVGLAGLALNLLVTWNLFVAHTQSYLSLLALHVGVLVALCALHARIAWPVLGAQILYGLVVWILHPLLTVHRTDWLMLACAPIALAGLVAATYRSDTPTPTAQTWAPKTSHMPQPMQHIG